MDSIYVRLPTALRQRVNLAAAARDLNAATYIRRHVERWLRDPSTVNAVEGEAQNGLKSRKVPVPGSVRIRLNVAAAERDVSVGALVVRILHAYTPHPTELLLQSINGGIIEGAQDGG